MEFDIVKKYTAELDNNEMYLLVDLVNTCFYKKTVPNKLVEELFFSDLKICNFIVEHEGKNIGLFQAKDLPQIESVYFSSASILPKYRGKGIHPTLVDYRLSHYRDSGRKYAGAMSMNPSVIKNLVKSGFFLPAKSNPELLQKAKKIITEMEGNDLKIRDDFVIPHQSIKDFPNLADIGTCDDAEINRFINGHMDIEKGDRLFLVRKI